MVRKLGMFFFFILFCITQNLFSAPYNSLLLSELKIDNIKSPTGLTNLQPNFSWIIISKDFKRRNIHQTAYQIIVSSSLERLNKNFGDLWDSEMVRSSSTNQISYNGKGFNSSRQYWWKVRIWDELNKTSQWSDPESFITGVLRPSDWQSVWMTTPPGMENFSSHLFRNEFMLRSNFKKVVVHVSSTNFYDLRINGNKVSEDVLNNGKAIFDNKLCYKTYDITESVWKGTNAVGVVTLRYPGMDAPQVFLQINVSYYDGSFEILSSDEKWKVSKGPSKISPLKSESVDLNSVQKGWDKAFFTYSPEWKNVMKSEYTQIPESNILPPFIRSEQLKIKDKAKWDQTHVLYDLGKYAYVLPRMAVVGKKNSRVVITPLKDISIVDSGIEIDQATPLMNESMSFQDLNHAWKSESKRKGGKLFPDSLSRAKNIEECKSLKNWSITLSGDSYELFNPAYTPTDARYLLLTFFPAPNDTLLPKVISLEADIVETGYSKTGQFLSSDDDYDFKIDSISRKLDKELIENYLNQIEDLKEVDWSDFVSFSGSYNYKKDFSPLYEKFLTNYWKEKSFKDDKTDDFLLKKAWQMYLYYGNSKLLSQVYDGMDKFQLHVENSLVNDTAFKDLSLLRLTELFTFASALTKNYEDNRKWEYKNQQYRKLYGFSKTDSLANKFGRIYLTSLDFPVDSIAQMNRIPELCYVQTAGIGVDDFGRGAGFKRILIKPTFKDGLSYVVSSYTSLSGIVTVSWKLLMGKLSIDVSVPPNTKALLHIPTDIDKDFRERGIPNEQSLNVRHFGDIEGYAIYELDSGNYGFQFSLRNN